MEPMVRASESRIRKQSSWSTWGYKGNDTNMDNYVCHSFQKIPLRYCGMMTKTNKIGVVGSHPIPEIIRNINALTLGAQSVNPDIEVEIVWINSWFDPPKDMDAAKVLAEQNNDILFTTTDSPSVVTLAEKLDGVWSMGNDGFLWDSLDLTVTSLV